MPNYPGPALVTLATSLLLFACAAYVGRCRIRFAIQAPATSGHPQFEIAYRIQMNTSKHAALPAGAVGVRSQPVERLGDRARCPVAAGRIWYALAYARDPKTRGSGFLLSMLAFGALGLGGAWGVLRGLIG
jgi:glutathione S-transferase